VIVRDTHAPGLAYARHRVHRRRPLALFQAGLILKAKAVLQCPDDSARPALACSGQTVSKRFGPIQGSNNHREREIFTEHRAIDRYVGPAI